MIAPEILHAYATLNQAQRDAIGHADGPLLVIAGPGAGKTLTLVLRTLNLLMTGKAQPKEIVVCTFTEKAAYELRDRISAAALTLGYVGDLSELRVGTIHGICQRLLLAWRHQTPLGAGFEILDRNWACPKCSATGGEILCGRELSVESIEVT